MLNCTYPWGNLPFHHDQTFMWSLPHCHRGKVVSIHKLHFMFSISWHLCNTFLPTPIQSSNQRWMWNSNPWHQVHLGPSPRLGCFPTRHCFHAFNSMSRGVIFQECATNEDIINLFPLFVHFMRLNLPCFIVIVTVMAIS
jgi:hypothetical protein